MNYLRVVHSFIFFCCIKVGVSQNTIIVHFPYGSAVPSETDIRQVEKVARENPSASWKLEGRASSNGSHEYNKKLSSQRTSAVESRLLGLGVIQSKIVKSHVGEEMANPDKDQAEDRIVVVTYVVPVPEKKEEPVQAPINRAISVSVWDGLDRKKISGSYQVGNTQVEFKNDFRVEVPENTPLSLRITSPGYKDTVVVIDSQSPAEYKIELLPDKVVEKLVFNNIYFFPNSPEILPESFRALEELYKQLKDRTDIRIQIRGHVNWPLYMENSPELHTQHQKLSEARALAVVNWLVKKGIAREILSHKGLGNSQMLYPNATTEGQQAYNRRVEVILLEK